jgi:hypothetical protein
MRVLSSLSAAACSAIILSGLAAAQSSDECSNATPVAGYGSFSFNNASATDSNNGSPCGSIGRDIWFAWTATVTENAEFSTCGGASFDTVLAAYSGSCGSLSLLTCNDDTCGLRSTVDFSAMAGTTYFIRIGSFSGGQGGAGTFTAATGGVGSGGCMNPATGADVIVGDIPASATYAAVGGMSAYSLATTSCNVGDQELLWFSNNNSHPVIGQNIYRIENGRFEQVGLGWLKHGFFALQQDLCCDCDDSGTGTLLGVGCSDPYGATLNGSQGGLGPRSQVNAFTGAFPYPFQAQGQTGDSVFKRVQVPTADVNPAMHPNAVYLGEAQYVTPDDSAAGNGANSVSYCELNRPGSTTGGSFRLNVTGGSTVREQCAVRGWEAADPTVVVEDILVPGEGVFCAGSNAIDNGDGTWRYEYAVFNNNSDFSGQSFSVPFGAGVTVTNVGMSFPLYHSGEPYTNQAWNSSVGASSVSWNTETFAQNVNANALRWGTTYSFWFTANAAPTTVSASLGLFKPGNPGSQSVALIGPDGGTGGAIISNYCSTNPNSTGQSTAIVASNVDLTARSMDLQAMNMPVSTFGFFITSLQDGFVANPGGSAGNLCVVGSIGRGVGGGVLNSGATGSFTGPVDLDMIPTPTGTTSVMAGETRYFQAWHRDSVIGIPTSNFSDGVRVVFP